jgi:hypothetical protein
LLARGVAGCIVGIRTIKQGDEEMTAYSLYHGEFWITDSVNFDWIKNNAMPFHKSRYAKDVFILPRNI